jgi:uncharacterized protein YxeA
MEKSMKTVIAVIALLITVVVGVWQFSSAKYTADATAKATLDAAAAGKAANAARYNAEYLARRNMDKIEEEYLKVTVVETYVTPDCLMGRGWVEVDVSWTFDTVHWESTKQWCTVNDLEGSCYSKEELKHKFPPEWFDSKQAKHAGGWLVCDRELKPVTMFE